MPDTTFFAIVYILPTVFAVALVVAIARTWPSSQEFRRRAVIYLACWLLLVVIVVILGAVAGVLYAHVSRHFPRDPALPLRPALIVLGFVTGEVASGTALLVWLKSLPKLPEIAVVRPVSARSFAGWKPMPTLTCDVVFLGTSEGGRSQPVRELDSRSYRPHLVIGPRSQRQPLMEHRKFKEVYYDVIFSDGPSSADPGAEYRVVVLLPFYPQEPYQPFVPGATFTIREGFEKIVGHGVVLSRSDPPRPNSR